MARRATIRLSSSPVVRVVPPGYDVDSAPIDKFLLHESFLFSQPFFYQFVACPFAGYSGKDARDENVTVGFTSVGNVPDFVVYPVISSGAVCFPAPWSEATGTSANGFPGLETVRVRISLTTNSFNLRFLKNLNSLVSPLGAYVILFRRAD